VEVEQQHRGSSGARAGLDAALASDGSRTDQLEETVRQLERAMESRAVIEQAKGIIWGRNRCGPDEAFDILRRVSQRENRKVNAIAADLVAKVAATDSPPPPPPKG
jgi:AmiR/NasT family two-component response regulator